jgi:ribosome-associated protein
MAARCASAKKATEIKVLDLTEVTSFTDYFVICSAANARQSHAVCDEIEKGLKEMGERPVSIEGYEAGEWILMDYGDFLVHIFSSTARSFYDLERLWRHARALEIPAD